MDERRVHADIDSPFDQFKTNIITPEALDLLSAVVGDDLYNSKKLDYWILNQRKRGKVVKVNFGDSSK